MISNGDVYLLGHHRLMCGDSTSWSDVQKLMDGKVATMMFTDPPYNINYVPEERLKGGRKVNKLGGIMHDFDFDYQKWFKMLETGIISGAVYICGADKNYIDVYQWMGRTFTAEPTIIIWNKNNFSIGNRNYKRKYEFVFYNHFPAYKWNGGNEQVDVWNVCRENVMNYVHPTQKPVRLIKRAIENSSDPGDIVLDLFGGSGSTLIAADLTGRICYTMELDPKYIEVIIKRYEEYTGAKAIKLS